MYLTIAFVLLVSTLSPTTQNQTASSTTPATIYVEPTDDGFQTYVVAAILKKKVDGRARRADPGADADAEGRTGASAKRDDRIQSRQVLVCVLRGHAGQGEYFGTACRRQR